MRLRVSFHRAADVGNDFDSQLARGGFLVRVEPPETLAQFTPIPLELIAPDGEELTLDAQVIQAFPGVGVAVTFAASPELAEWAALARAASGEDRDTTHAWATAEREREERAPIGTASRIPVALRGNRDERMAIMRENVPALHGHVLRNPGLQLDEVAAIAKMRTVSSELLKQIADKREWAQRPEIALALVRNPKTPVGIAIKLLDHVPAAELRQLAKDTNTRTPIQHAARRKVIG
ncbi:MAG: hypothetical protein ACXWUG_22240 [Polyangiales bacterium]